MALTITTVTTPQYNPTIFGVMRVGIYDLTFDNSYPNGGTYATSGEAFVAADIGFNFIGLILHDGKLRHSTFATGMYDVAYDYTNGVFHVASPHGNHTHTAGAITVDTHNHAFTGLTIDAHAGHLHTISGSGAAPGGYAQGNTIGLSADADAATLTTGTVARTGITGIQSTVVGVHTLGGSVASTVATASSAASGATATTATGNNQTGSVYVNNTSTALNLLVLRVIVIGM